MLEIIVNIKIIWRVFWILFLHYTLWEGRLEGTFHVSKEAELFFFLSLKTSLSSVYKFIASLSWNKLFLNSVAPFLGDCAFHNEPLTWACFSFEQNFLSNSSWEDGEAELRFSRVAVKKRQPTLLKARFKVLYAAGHCKGNA